MIQNLKPEEKDKVGQFLLNTTAHKLYTSLISLSLFSHPLKNNITHEQIRGTKVEPSLLAQFTS